MKISVVIPLPEVSPHLQEHYESIKAQTRPPDEIVFSSGKSAFPVDEAVKQCNGDIIVLSDQENIWFPEKLTQITQLFSDFPESDIVLANADLVDENLRPLGCSLWESIGFGPNEQKALKDKKKLSGLLKPNAIATIAFRSSYKPLVLPLPNDLSIAAWIALVCCAAGRVSLIQQPLSSYRLRGENQFGFEEPNDLARELSLLKLVAERLKLNGTTELAARMDHLAARSNLPAERSKRIRRILKELLTRRYHRYSYGFNSALKDILVPPPRN